MRPSIRPTEQLWSRRLSLLAWICRSGFVCDSRLLYDTSAERLRVVNGQVRTETHHACFFEETTEYDSVPNGVSFFRAKSKIRYRPVWRSNRTNTVAGQSVAPELAAAVGV